MGFKKNSLFEVLALFFLPLLRDRIHAAHKVLYVTGLLKKLRVKHLGGNHLFIAVFSVFFLQKIPAFSGK